MDAREFERLWKEYVDIIAKKKKEVKEEYAFKLGKLIFDHCSKYDERFELILSRIHSNKYKILTITSFTAAFYTRNSKQKILDLVDDKLITSNNFNDEKDDINRIKVRLYFELFEMPDWNTDDRVWFLIKSGKYIQLIDDPEDKAELQKKMGLNLKNLEDPRVVLQSIIDFQNKDYDDLPNSIYEINDDPSLSDKYRSKYSMEAIREVNFRAHLDWFVWHLLANVELLDKKPEIYFEILLNLSRCSDYNIIIKNEYLVEVGRFLSSLKPNKDKVNNFLDINNRYNQSFRWKDRIENRLKKIPINA